jgi:hypothetical protein
MLMIPKTLAYVAIAVLGDQELYGTKRVTAPTGTLPTR